MNPIRIQKLLADQNIASRRKIEAWVEAGRICVNDKTARLGDKATLHDSIKIDGKAIKLTDPDKVRVLMYHKPDGQICSKFEAFHENTVFDALPPLSRGRWISIGRLDINTSGLLLFTNHGEIAHQLMHPKFEWERVYLARTRGKLTPDQSQALLSGVCLEGVIAKCSQLNLIRANGANCWYQIGLYEGRNREVKKLFGHFDLQVNRLKRIQYGPFALPMGLQPGQHQELTHQQIQTIESKLAL